MADCRLVLSQGPIQSVAASAAVRFLEQDGRRRRNVLVVGGLDASDRRLVDATVRCAAGSDWDSVVTATGDLPGREQVSEVLCVRNWQPFNVDLLSRFPEATKLIYGDGIGLIDPVPAEGSLRIEEAVVTAPQVDRIGAADGLRVQVLEPRYLRDAIDAARVGTPQLAAHDEELAEFARDGLLILTANLTEARISTPRAERAQFASLAASALELGAPIVIKAHPRATLAQATTLARALRQRGHRVRVVGDDFSTYPIELFAELTTSVARVLPGFSSSAISLSLLHDATVDPALPLNLALTTMFPDAVRSARQVVAHHQGVIRALESWDGAALIESVPVDRPRLWTRILSAPAKRLFAWSPARAQDSEPAELEGPARASLQSGAGGGGELVGDPVSGVAWVVPLEHAEAVRAALGSAPREAAARVATVAGSVSAHPGEFILLAAVIAASHRVAWRARVSPPSPSPANAQLTAERLEAILESSLEIVSREPGLGRRARALPPGVVRFQLRTRTREKPAADD